MKIFKVIIFTLICTIHSIVLLPNYIYSEEVQEEKIEVLFISSYNTNFISYEDQLKGINEGFENQANIRVEYMDLKTFQSKENEEKLYNLLEQSLKLYDNIDVVIAGDDEATEFCSKYRNELFKDIPISFFGVQDYEIRERALEKELISGVTEVESIKDNIELIKKFHPKVDTITFVDSQGIEKYEDVISAYPEFNFEWIVTNNMQISEVKNKLSKLDENNAIIQLYVSDFKDSKTLTRQEINKLIADSNSNIPIYNVLTYDIGDGSIGGKVINHNNQGNMAAKIAIDLLKGKDKEDIYISDDSANSYVFDYKYLKNFGIRERELPEGSVVLNSPSKVFEEYKEIIIAFIVLVVALIGIVITLLWYIHFKRKYEKAILKAMHNAEEVNKVKVHFISNISHELKTPINVIMSAVQLNKLKNIKDPMFCENIKNLNIIDDNCNRLLRLINNIIDIQKSELDEVKLKLSNINIVDLVENLVSSVIPYAESKNLSLIFDTNEEEVIMSVDINKIERIILNLLSNAIKFSNENSSIKINLLLEEYLYITIEDEGIGIEEDKINNIFDKFTQIDNSLCRKNEGSGIGLSIVKSFVELHKGEIYVVSKVNEGTTFTIKLPINKIDNKKSEVFSTDKMIQNTNLELSDIYM